MHQFLPKARIDFFEPILESYSLLCQRMKRIASFTAFNCALGDTSGVFEFNRNVFSASSSFLKMTHAHLQAFPRACDKATARVEMCRLDEISSKMFIDAPTLIKIDVQGSEDKIIDGGIETFRSAAYIVVEVSFIPLHAGQPSFDDINQQLSLLGFQYMGNLDQTIYPYIGQILYADAVFLSATAPDLRNPNSTECIGRFNNR